MFLTLASDNSEPIFPRNAISKFTVKLAEPLNIVSRNYVVSLQSLFYPHDFHNIETVDIELQINDSIFTVELQGKYYENVTELLHVINLTLNTAYLQSLDLDAPTDEEQYKFQFFLNYRGKVLFKVKDARRQRSISSIRIDLGYALLSKLGFDSPINSLKRESEKYPDINAGSESIIVYCDLIKPQRIVGDQILQVLKLVPISGEPKKITCYQPTHLEYFDIAKNQISEITIELRDNLGRLMKFNSGKTVVELHLKRKGL